MSLPLLLLVSLAVLDFLCGKPHAWPGVLGRVLTSREWQLLFRLLAILFFVILLVCSGISAEFPRELFVYGRF